MNVLEDFYYGNIEPQEIKTKLTPKLKSKLKTLSETEEKLETQLSPEAMKTFSEYRDLYNEFMCISCCDSFISGMKLGAKMTHELFL